MQSIFNNIQIPKESFLGINYSGMHDTSVSIVSPKGVPIFAASLERYSRIKMDGRFPHELIANIPWEKIKGVAVACAETYSSEIGSESIFHPAKLLKTRNNHRGHGEEFYKQLDVIPIKKNYVPHHLAHAASAFWLSGKNNSTCLVYDGGMFNEEWFGGVYSASNLKGMEKKDAFSALKYGNITLIYSAVTALLGFKALRHEGKITGLSAYGKTNSKCLELLNHWLIEPEIVEAIFSWENVYSESSMPNLRIINDNAIILKEKLNEFSKEDIAATVQYMSEDHVEKILDSMILQKGGLGENLCLAGGLFANVKINQMAAKKGFNSVFVCPAMSDDGAGLGAALHLASQYNAIKPTQLKSIYIGSNYNNVDIKKTLTLQNISFIEPPDAEMYLAQLLSDNKIVATYQGSMEFGPRALGNRSILANASNVKINDHLNKLLSRTEFMPFAPICLKESSQLLFKKLNGIEHACEFMTITTDCTDYMKETCPAVVHVDGTARPQLVNEEINAFIYKILKYYINITGNHALVNTSFNIHEEPIVCTPDDAIRGFFESGLDALYLNGVIILLEENKKIEINYIKNKAIGLENNLKNQKKEFEVKLNNKDINIIKYKNEIENLKQEKLNLINQLDIMQKSICYKINQFIKKLY